MEIEKLYQNKEWLYQRYIIEKLSIGQIGKEINRDRITIYNWLHKLNIPVRSNSESKANHCNLSSQAIEWINGELLGDGCLWSQSVRSAKFIYGSKYEEYIQYISETLKSFGIKQSGKINKRYHKNFNCYSYHYSSLNYVELLSIRKKWYPKGKKIVPKDIKLTPLTCRQWFIGDGSLKHLKRRRPYITLATNGFIIKNVEWLRNQLKQLNFKTTRRSSNNSIGVSSISSTKDFLNYIGVCPVKCYQYKWNY